MNNLRKRAERNAKVNRTIGKIERTIAKLEQMKEEYMQKAVEARSRGETGSYNLAKSGINATLTQIKRAKEMLLNIRITAELQKMGDTNADFLTGMSTIAKRISKINRQSDFVKLQKEINKALSGMEEAQAGLDGFLQNSEAAFATIASADGALSDEKLDEYISGKVSEKELMFDCEIDALTKSAPVESGEALSVRVGGAETAIAKPFPGPNGVFDFNAAKQATIGLGALRIEPRDNALLGMLESGAEPSIVLGKNAGGKIERLKFADAPHVLVGGALGSGKSSLIHRLICGASLETADVKFLLVDIGGRELTRYNGVNNLACDVITDIEGVLPALSAVEEEIDKRYAALSKVGATDIAEYNARSNSPLPYIILVFDEFGDCKKLDKFESAYCRIARQSALTGIYTVLCTRELNSDVITSVILSSVDAKIAFKTASNEESELILGEGGAEGLQPNEMLCALSDTKKYAVPSITEKEISLVVRALRGNEV